MQPELKAKLSDKRYNIAMENHEFGVAPEAFTKWIVLNDTYDILSTSIDRYVVTPVVIHLLLRQNLFCFKLLSQIVPPQGSCKYA